jgi:hypothetical protein
LPQQNENNRLARAEPSSNLSRKARRSFIATGEGTDRNKEARQKKTKAGKSVRPIYAASMRTIPDCAFFPLG